MPAHDAPGGGANDLRRLDVGAILDADDLGANRAEVLRDVDDGDRYAGREDASPQARLSAGDHDRHQDGQQQRRERIDGVGDDDEHAIDPTAEITRDEAQEHAGEDRQQHRHDDGDDRSARAPDGTAEHIEAADRRAPDMRLRRGRLRREGDAVGTLDLRVSVRRDPRREHGHDQEEGRQDETGDEHALLPADGDLQVAHDRQSREPGFRGFDVELLQTRVPRHADFQFRAFAHVQYLTRGSINALITSTMKLTTETMIAIRMTMPCTATKSRALR